MGWLTRDDPQLAEMWPGCFDLTDETLDQYLDAAKAQCIAYAPALPPDAPIPAHYRLAQALQARALSRAGLVGSGDQMGGYGDTVTVFPMDWQVKNLLRPQQGRPYVR